MDHGTTTASRSMVDSRPLGGVGAQEVIVIARREREEVVGVLTNDTT
jgi:hypothetical protein